jgi:GTP cyclohydrolase I
LDFQQDIRSDVAWPSEDVSLSPRQPSDEDVERAVRTLIAATGDNPDREGLRDTPARVMRAWNEWFAGYVLDPAEILARTFATDGYDDMVALRSIPLVSTCEHHLAPITGHVHVAYRPADRVVGLSKLSRLVEVFARRLQLQERLTYQIANTLNDYLKPRGVAVVIEAAHGCMSGRGIRQHGVSTVTRCWRGDFADDPVLRREFLDTLPAAV